MATTLNIGNGNSIDINQVDGGQLRGRAMDTLDAEIMDFNAFLDGWGANNADEKRTYTFADGTTREFGQKEGAAYARYLNKLSDEMGKRTEQDHTRDLKRLEAAHKAILAAIKGRAS